MGVAAFQDRLFSVLQSRPMATRKPAKASSVFQLKITLVGIKPAIWRRILVPTNITLGKLHFVVNEAMGWTCSHLHSFAVGDSTFGDPRLDASGELGYEDERKVRLDAVVLVGHAFGYEYDFGDGWVHEIQVEKQLNADSRLTYPLCIGGARACPPEDCGGPPGYQGLVQTLADKHSAEHDELLTWVGGQFDPEGFDTNRTNVALRAQKR
jgi:hypothetical protein